MWEINEQIRKYHYWRGFRAGLILVAPFVAFLVICLHKLINLNIN